jgi:hypothetical protein
MTGQSVRKIIAAAVFFSAVTCNGYAAGDEVDPWVYPDNERAPAASDIWLPIVSFVLPGAGQWARSQPGYGSAYSGIAIAGVYYAANASGDLQDDDRKNADIGSKNIALRKYTLGLQTAQSMGGLSLYHTFRSAVWQRQKYGQYTFLGNGEHPSDILLAPFRFDYLTRSSTWIPLTVAAGVTAYAVNHPDKGFRRVSLQPADPAFAAGFSYNAGTHEEAVFRGWLMPLLHEAGLSNSMANLAQSTVFALAHLGSNPVPLPQFLLGLHFGHLTATSHWTISESIFIHAWWDVIAFTGNYYLEKTKTKSASIRHPHDQGPSAIPFILPAINLAF